MATATAVIGSDFPVGFVGPATSVGSAAITEASTDNSVEWLHLHTRLPSGSSTTAMLDELSAGDTLTITYPTYGLSVTGSNVERRLWSHFIAWTFLRYSKRRRLEILDC